MILVDYDILSERSDEVNPKKDKQLIQKIVKELKDNLGDLNGLSAPQIGYKKRLFIIKFTNKIAVYINPVITNAYGLTMSRETCPSFPNKRFLRPRAQEIKVAYQRTDGKMEERNLVGLAATVFQELTDHLDGLLLPDIGVEIGDNFEQMSQEKQMSFIQNYLDSIKEQKTELEKEIETNQEAKQMKDAVDFMNSVKSGETIKTIETVKVD